MKKYSVEEAKKVHSLGRARYTHLHKMLLQLEPGEKLEIEKGTDWKSKNTPYRLVRNFGKKNGRKFKNGRNLDKTGWVVERLS